VSLSPPSPRTPDLSIDDSGIAVVRFDDSERSVNVFTEAVMLRLGEVMGEIQGEAERGNVRGVLIVSGKETSFIAGADIDAVAAIESPHAGQEGARAGQETFLQVDHLPVPTLAAIHGSCMGGGLELALACRFRVASGHPSTRLALPEVQLGILPAWGGTTRLPRLIGLKSALDLLMTGRTIDATRALKLGVIDAVLPHGSFERFARGLWKPSSPDIRPPAGGRGLSPPDSWRGILSADAFSSRVHRNPWSGGPGVTTLPPGRSSMW
jgi:3-hydroxyacyl-CoA dehydrogenase / enoyl-CoA hydratase / 3-hydroxybutyryl-CoA epimerase